MFMDPLRLTIALGPLAVYFLLLGLIHLWLRPFLTTGSRDTAALGIAISGFMIVGPMELFVPEAAAARFGPYVWLLLIVFYALCLTLLVLLLRPRLVIYNLDSHQLRSILAGMVGELDREARWAGESLYLPQLGVQLHIESCGFAHCTQLVAAGPQQNYAGWRRLEIALGHALRRTRAERTAYGVSLLLIGLVMIGLITFSLVRDPEMVAQSLREMLRL